MPSGWPGSPTTCSSSHARRPPRAPADDVQLDELARAVARADPRSRPSRPARWLSAATGRRSSAHSRTSSRTLAATGPRAAGSRSLAEQADGLAHAQRQRRGAGAASPTRPSARSSASGVATERRPGSGLGLAIVRATAERHGGRAYADGARFTIELPGSQRSLRVFGYNGGENRRKDRREIPSHTPDPIASLLLIAAALALAAGGAAIAVAAGGGGPTPPAKPLDQAIHDALSAPAPGGDHRARQVHEHALPVGRAARQRRLGA